MQQTVFLIEVIVNCIQLCLQFLNHTVRLVQLLSFQQFSGGITQCNECFCSFKLAAVFLVNPMADILFSLKKYLIVLFKETVITQIRWNLYCNPVYRSGVYLFCFLWTDFSGESANRILQSRFPIKSVLCNNHCTAAIQLIAFNNRTEYHIRIFCKVAVYR